MSHDGDRSGLVERSLIDSSEVMAFYVTLSIGEATFN